MQRLTLPGTDMTTSQLCLGTNQFGTVLDDERVADILAAYTALGGNFLDTAAAYRLLLRLGRQEDTKTHRQADLFGKVTVKALHAAEAGLLAGEFGFPGSGHLA